MDKPLKDESDTQANPNDVVAASRTASAPCVAGQECESQIDITQFAAVSLKVGQVIEAENVEKSNKLLRLQVDLGEPRGNRQILAGIAKHYEPDSLIGRSVVVVANLKPAKLMGQLSEGMLLCASSPDGNLELIHPGTGMPPGSDIR